MEEPGAFEHAEKVLVHVPIPTENQVLLGIEVHDERDDWTWKRWVGTGCIV